MNRLTHKRTTAARRTNRVRSRVGGSPERPRLSVNISNLHVSAQLIDDTKSTTLAAVSTVGKKVDSNLSAKAAWVGSELGKQAKKAKISKVVLDRGSRRYHGRVKALAEAARAEGLEF